MSQSLLSKATLGRLPLYLQYLRSHPQQPKGCVSATTIARALGLGEVLVRKDLGAVSGAGKPRTGYVVSELQETLEQILAYDERYRAVLVGAGNLGSALFHYPGFSAYGLQILAAFDNDPRKVEASSPQRPIYPLSAFPRFVQENHVHIGILAVPSAAAQDVCDLMTENGISAIWSFSTAPVQVPDGVILQQENLALSLAYLVHQMDDLETEEEQDA